VKDEIEKHQQFSCYIFMEFYEIFNLTLNLLTTTIVAPPSKASKWQMGFNSSFKGLRGVKFRHIDFMNSA